MSVAPAAGGRASGLFITGTDTGVGKTVLSCALLAALATAGARVRAHKPVVTGLDEPAGAWPRDHELLATLTGMLPEEVSPLRYGPATSPQLAAELAGVSVDYDDLLARASTSIAVADAVEATLVMEGVGGLLAPLSGERSVCDLAVDVALPLLIAARPGLGTINHTLLTLEAARARGLDVRAVVLTPWPSAPSRLERSNRDTIGGRGEVAVHTLPSVRGCSRAQLARAGAVLPWRSWPECVPARAAARTAAATVATSSASIT